MFKKDIIFILILILISLSITFICQKECLFNKYIAHDDSSQYIFPFYRVKDPQLFQNDIFVEYSLSYNTKGSVIIYNFFSKFMDPLVLSKILPFILHCLTAIYFFLIGKRIKNTFVGFLAAIIFIMHSWTFFCFSGGHAKAFSFLLLSTFIYYLLIKRYKLILIILFLQIFIYPSIAAISILSLFILSFLSIINSPKFGLLLNKGSKFFIYIGLVGIFTMYFMYLLPDSFKGPLYSFREIISMPEFYYGGRAVLFINSLVMLKDQVISENVTGLPLYSFPTWFLLSISGLGLFLIIKKKITVNNILTVFCISGLFLFILAWLALFNLYSPGRFLKFSSLLYLIFLSALTINRIFIEVGKKRKLTRLFIISLVIILIYFPFLDRMQFTFFKNKGLYDYLTTLPKNVLIAGHPFEMNEIPLFSKRKVFIEYELSLPFYKNYYEKIKQRTYDFFRIYYSNDIDEIKQICSFYKIDYFVIKKEHFTKSYLDVKEFYINPFNDKIKQIIKQNIQNGFILTSIPKRYRLYEDDNFFVINIHDIAKTEDKI